MKNISMYIFMAGFVSGFLSHGFAFHHQPAKTVFIETQTMVCKTMPSMSKTASTKRQKEIKQLSAFITQADLRKF